MRSRGAPVLVNGGLRLVFSVAGLAYDNVFCFYVLWGIGRVRSSSYRHVLVPELRYL
jgi:hypothetical protein